MHLLLKLCIFFTVMGFAYAKEYTVTILVDTQSQQFIQQIQKETRSVFFKNDTVIFHTHICDKNCKQVATERFDVAVFQATSKVPIKATYVINYDAIRSEYDRKRVIKAASLGIFEHIKESKTDTVFLQTAPKVFEQNAAQNVAVEELGLKDLAKFIQQNNHQYRHNQNTLALNRLDISNATSRFKPRISLFSNYTQIDEDRALYSQGQYPQKQTNVGIALQQLLFSPQAYYNIKIQKILHQSKQQSIKAANDELLYEAILLYFNNNKARQKENILKNKKEFIQKNLFFAKQRVEISIKDRSDIYRWESQLADIDIELSNAKQQRKELEYELFNALGLQSHYGLKRYTIDDPLFKLLSRDLPYHTQKQTIQELFFQMVIRQHPQIKQLKEALRAQSQKIAMNKKEFYMPTVALEGNYKKQLSKDGAGSNVAVAWDDEEFEAMLTLRFDLFDGSQKQLNLQKSKLQRQNLQITYNRVKDTIEKNLKTHYYFLQQSYENINYAKKAFKAAYKNVDLMQDRYEYQKATLIELLDAHDSMIRAKLNHNIAITNYLQNLVSIYFLIGKIDLLVDDSIKDAFEHTVQTHLHQR
ncbi:MAG: TolC family protein [Campylobacterota bacterium]